MIFLKKLKNTKNGKNQVLIKSAFRSIEINKYCIFKLLKKKVNSILTNFMCIQQVRILNDY